MQETGKPSSWRTCCTWLARPGGRWWLGWGLTASAGSLCLLRGPCMGAPRLCTAMSAAAAAWEGGWCSIQPGPSSLDLCSQRFRAMLCSALHALHWRRDQDATNTAALGMIADVTAYRTTGATAAGELSAGPQLAAGSWQQAAHSVKHGSPGRRLRSRLWTSLQAFRIRMPAGSRPLSVWGPWSDC